MAKKKEKSEPTQEGDQGTPDIEDRLEEVARVFLDKSEELGKYSDEDRVNRALSLAYCAAKLIEVADRIV